MLLNLKNYFHVEKSVFSKEFCEKIISVSEKNWERDKIEKDFEYRKSKVVFLQNINDPEIQFIKNTIFPVVEQIKKQKWKTFKLYNLQPMQYTVYKAPHGNYSWHSDTSDRNQPTMKNRLLSFSIQLTDPQSNYEGGEFEIIEELSQNWSCCKINSLFNFDKKKTITAEDFPQGSILVFPSLLGHRVTTITEGTRRSLVGWTEGTFI